MDIRQIMTICIGIFCFCNNKCIIPYHLPVNIFLPQGLRAEYSNIIKGMWVANSLGNGTTFNHCIRKYLHRKYLATRNIHADCIATIVNQAPIISTVKYWATEFRNDNIEEHSNIGHPPFVIVEENFNRIYLTTVDRQLTIYLITYC